MSEYKNKNKMSEEEIAQANARVIQHFKDTLKLNPYHYWMSLMNENLMDFKDAAIPVLEEMLDYKMMQSSSTANQFEKLLLYATFASAGLIRNNVYNFSDYLLKMGAVRKEGSGYVFVKELGYWKGKIVSYQQMDNGFVSISKEEKEKTTIGRHGNKDEKLMDSFWDYCQHFEFLEHMLRSFKDAKEDLLIEPSKYEEYDINTEDFFDVLIAYYQGIYNKIIRGIALTNYLLVEYYAKTKSKADVKTYLLPAAWLLGFSKAEFYQLSYNDACSNKIDRELVHQLGSYGFDYEIMTDDVVDKFHMFENALLIDMDEKEGSIENQASVLKRLLSKYKNVKKSIHKTGEVSVQEMRERLDKHCNKTLRICEDYNASDNNKKEYQKFHNVDFVKITNHINTYIQCYEAIINNIHKIYRYNDTLKEMTKEIYHYYTTTLEELKIASKILTSKKEKTKPTKVKTKKEEKTAVKKEKKALDKKEKTTVSVTPPPVVKEEPLEIKDTELLNAYDLLSKISKGRKYETAKKAYDNVRFDKGVNPSINQFEVLLLSDDDHFFHAENIVKHHYEKANKQNKVYGALGTCLQSIQTGMKTLKSKQPTKAGKILGLIGAAVSILVLLFVLNSSMTAFLWSTDAEEFVAALATIIIAVIGLFTGGIVGGVIGLFGGALVMVLVSSMFGIAKIMKFVCIVLFVILALVCLIMGFSNNETEEDRKLRETLRADYKKAFTHINRILDTLKDRGNAEACILQYYENVKQQFEQNKVE